MSSLNETTAQFPNTTVEIFFLPLLKDEYLNKVTPHSLTDNFCYSGMFRMVKSKYKRKSKRVNLK